MKKLFENKIERLTAKRNELKARAMKSEDVNEVRSIQEKIDDIDADIAECRDMITAIEAEERKNNPVPAGAQKVNGNVMGTFKEEERSDNILESVEYRTAFMNHIQKGTAIPAEFRAAAISTEDTGAAIPLTIMREVINTVRKRYGNLYSKVKKTNMAGGVEYPIGALQASFKWISESTVSPRQKVDALGKISFKYHTAEIRVAQTFLANLLTMEAFESELAKVIAIAYLKAMDYGIVKGTGEGQMLGILNDPRVAATEQVVTFTAAQLGNWTEWRKRLFAKMPLGYRDGEFIFPVSTVDAYLETMADNNNNPIFRQATGLEVNDGDAMNPSGRFFGREVSLVEPDIIADFDSASSNDVIGIFWQPQEYAINENFGFTMRRYFDEELNEWVDKALVVVDGKVLNPNGIWILKKA